MCSSRFMSCIVLIAGFVLISVSHAAWQPDQPDKSENKQSPFSLKSTEQPIAEQAPVAPPSAQQQSVNSSVFSLPSESEINPSPGIATSPFSLTAEENEHMSDSMSAAVELTAVELQKKGTALAREGKFEEARELLAHSLEKDPESLVTLNNLGLVMRKLGRLNDALQAYQFALKLNDKYALTYKNLGILLEKQGEKELAVKAYHKYCLLAPDAADVQKVGARASWLNEQK